MAFHRASGNAELVHPLKIHGAEGGFSMLTHHDIADMHFRVIMGQVEPAEG